MLVVTAKVDMAMANFKSLLPNVRPIADFGSNRQHPGAASVLHKTEFQRLMSEAGVGGFFSGARATSCACLHSCLCSKVESQEPAVPLPYGFSGDGQEAFELRVG